MKKNRKTKRPVLATGFLSSTRDAVETAIALSKKRSPSAQWGQDQQAISRFSRWGERVTSADR